MWDSLNRKTKKELIQRLIASLEITRDKNYNIEIKNIKFTDEFISKSNKEYLDYLNEIGIRYSKQINKQELEKLEQDYFIFSTKKYEDNEYSEGDYLLPDLTIKDTKNININKYGKMRLTYLKEHKKSLYITLLMHDRLTNQLISVSKESENLLNNLMENYKKIDERLSEKSKETN